MRKLLLAAVAVAALTSPVLAANSAKTMSADFAGEWCFGLGYDAQTKDTNYTLPSWTEDGQCDKTKILSIRKYDFVFNVNDNRIVSQRGQRQSQ
jgi:hypothetical protein